MLVPVPVLLTAIGGFQCLSERPPWKCGVPMSENQEVAAGDPIRSRRQAQTGEGRLPVGILQSLICRGLKQTLLMLSELGALTLLASVADRFLCLRAKVGQLNVVKPPQPGRNRWRAMHRLCVSRSYLGCRARFSGRYSECPDRDPFHRRLLLG